MALIRIVARDPRVATRYAKRATIFLAMLKLAILSRYLRVAL